MRLAVERGAESLEILVVPRADQVGEREVGRIGAGVEIPQDLLDQYRTEVRLGPLAAVGAAVGKTVDMSCSCCGSSDACWWARRRWRT